MTALDPTSTLARIVLDHPECARVLRDHRLDYCCRGDVALASACEAKGIDLAAMSAALATAIAEERERGVVVDPRTLSTPDLVAHIVDRHHAYLRRTLPYVEQLARKVSRVHGAHEPSLVPLADRVAELREALEPHLDEEERVLFPMFVSASEPRAQVRAMLDDHFAVGELLGTIRTLSNDYAVPEWGCRSYRALMDGLRDIESDTLEHIHIENHVLVPRGLSAGTKQ